MRSAFILLLHLCTHVHILCTVKSASNVNPCASEHAKSANFVTTSPNMTLLSSFPTVINGEQVKKNVFVQIANSYDSFGTHLLNDVSGKCVENIRESYGPNIQFITREILKQWLNGKGKQPVTWNTLIWALSEAKLCTLVEDIQTSVSESALDTPFEGPVYDETLRFAEMIRGLYKNMNVIDQYQKLLKSVDMERTSLPFVMPSIDYGKHLNETIMKIQPGSSTLFTGDPGVGKSTRYMARKWAQGELLTHCVLTIRISLLATIPDLQTLLERVAFPDFTDHDSIIAVKRDLEQSIGERVCLILDALDEYVPSELGNNDYVYALIRREALNKATLIVRKCPLFGGSTVPKVAIQM